MAVQNPASSQPRAWQPAALVHLSKSRLPERPPHPLRPEPWQPPLERLRPPQMQERPKTQRAWQQRPHHWDERALLWDI